jgi:hypothetical protein
MMPVTSFHTCKVCVPFLHWVWHSCDAAPGCFHTHIACVSFPHQVQQSGKAAMLYWVTFLGAKRVLWCPLGWARLFLCIMEGWGFSNSRKRSINHVGTNHMEKTPLSLAVSTRQPWQGSRAVQPQDCHARLFSHVQSTCTRCGRVAQPQCYPRSLLHASAKPKPWIILHANAKYKLLSHTGCGRVA